MLGASATGPGILAAAGLWAPWVFLVGAVVAGVWLLPGSPDWLSKKLSAPVIETSPTAPS